MQEHPDMTKEEATNFFSEIFGGEHHFPSELKEKAGGWSICSGMDLSTYDYNMLTRCVFLAHDKCYRLSIKQGGPGKVKLSIWKRYDRDGSIYYRHPTIEQALATWREKHPIEEVV